MKNPLYECRKWEEMHITKNRPFHKGGRVKSELKTVSQRSHPDLKKQQLLPHSEKFYTCKLRTEEKLEEFCVAHVNFYPRVGCRTSKLVSSVVASEVQSPGF